jgi:hypothetical protein
MIMMVNDGDDYDDNNSDDSDGDDSDVDDNDGDDSDGDIVMVMVVMVMIVMVMIVIETVQNNSLHHYRRLTSISLSHLLYLCLCWMTAYAFFLWKVTSRMLQGPQGELGRVG